jgi:ribosome-binding protein aMBF1 (putative translation factor)
MNECYKCGVSGDKVTLYHAISNKGIIKICGDCNSLEKYPIMKKPTEEQISESKNVKQKSVQERLTNMNQNRFMGKEINLRTLVDKNFKSQIVQTPSDIIPNFHWTIQRIRRARKISREEFAKGIGEPESTVRMIEQGLLPEENYKIINKIEGFLKISLRKQGSSGFPDTSHAKSFVLDNSLTEKITPPKRLSFNPSNTKGLKIEDVKNMNSKDKKTITETSWEEEYSQDDEQFLDNPEENNEEE